ncbi:NAD(P)H-binding protein [Cellulomonas cellasea]|uniref:NmrA family transcriptional regulator n=2 Tax=Cellulomonas cellasea TaxID=43670 RepID=A0A0A0B5U7_9CELL|nr:NAD(P)H-binding protein [Cellulomonas cellasea]KGM00656.1 NmrA family transcriptional regulator [Cellulomonas cellasea DSM 20118]GEA88049.1 NmrA family transcriptional regulator [Cellulomonas cellasea]
MTHTPSPTTTAPTTTPGAGSPGPATGTAPSAAPAPPTPTGASSPTRTPLADPGTVLVLGGTGKTGRRVAARLRDRGVDVRIGSRSATPAFAWEAPSTWDAALDGVDAVYVCFVPDLAVPGAADVVRAFVARAEAAGVRRLVLLSGRGEEGAEECERLVLASRIPATVVRAAWFDQNFSEYYLVDGVLAGEVVLPAGDVLEPFVDADDIADVAVAALTEDGHAGELYEVTGPRLLTFGQAVAEIGAATGRAITYVEVPVADYAAAMAEAGASDDEVWLLTYLFTTVLDGRNSAVTDGVQRALGRPPRDFAEYARDAAAAGAWDVAAVG